jgi:hypothetical protein
MRAVPEGHVPPCLSGRDSPLRGLPDASYLNKGSGLTLTVFVATSLPSTLSVTL